MTDYERTHLCGGLYGDHCKHLLYATEDTYLKGAKRLKKYHVYCLAENRCRSMGCAASWTGCSPTWCPKRKAMKEASENENDH